LIYDILIIIIICYFYIILFVLIIIYNQESDEYQNITDDELNTILRLINKEEKVKINLLKYVYINKMNEIIQKITPNVELEINKNDNGM